MVNYFRCYMAQRPEGYWETLCIDLCLVARGDTPDAAKAAMMAQIQDYLEYVWSLPEQERSRFLSRKAPLAQHVKFHWIKFQWVLRELFKRDGDRPSTSGGPFAVPMPKAA